MRLLNTTTYELEDYIGSNVPSYAILSHRWGKGEIMYSDYRKGRCLTGPGYSKIFKACNFAKSRGHGFIWIDTCCIDKKSSAELTEAINSMFNWYRKAAECYAYLPDVHSERTDIAMEELRRSEWFRRGWTLQELIASSSVTFCTSSWRVIGDKRSTAHDHGPASIIKKATGVPRVVLRHPDKLWSFSVAERMSWASNRTITRVEDTAYCLLGLFGVNMPLLYGEGHNAILRLQREIMGGSLDESILAWSIDSAWCELPVCRRKPGVLSFAVLATRPDLLLMPRMCEDTALQHLPPSPDSSQDREALWNSGQLGPATSSGSREMSFLCDSNVMKSNRLRKVRAWRVSDRLRSMSFGISTQSSFDSSRAVTTSGCSTLDQFLNFITQANGPLSRARPSTCTLCQTSVTMTDPASQRRSMNLIISLDSLGQLLTDLMGDPDVRPGDSV